MKEINMATWDGNAFAIMGNTQKYLRKAKVPDWKINAVMDKARSSDYHNLLSVCIDALEDAGYEVVYEKVEEDDDWE